MCDSVLIGKVSYIREAIMEEKQLICGHCPYGGGTPLPPMTLRTPEVYFFLNTRITKSCGLNGGGGGGAVLSTLVKNS